MLLMMQQRDSRLVFYSNERLEGYWKIMNTAISNNSIPLAVYADRHTIFRSPNTCKLSLEDELAGKQVKSTQIGRAMSELGFNLMGKISTGQG